MTEKDVDDWIDELESFRKSHLDQELLDSRRKVYQDWLTLVKRKVAPGFTFDVMTPITATREPTKQEHESTEEAQQPSDSNDTGINSANPQEGVHSDLHNISFS